VICEKGGFLKSAWCGSADCEAKIKEETGATIRVIPFEKKMLATNCIICGRNAKEVAYFARSY
jgi:prolyl-tRNA synthetase